MWHRYTSTWTLLRLKRIRRERTRMFCLTFFAVLYFFGQYLLKCFLWTKNVRRIASNAKIATFFPFTYNITINSHDVLKTVMCYECYELCYVVLRLLRRATAFTTLNIPCITRTTNVYIDSEHTTICAIPYYND